MSLLCDVVEAVNEADYEEITKTVPELQVQVDNFKNKAYNFFQSIYVEHLTDRGNKSIIETNVKQYQNKLQNLTQKTESLQKRHIADLESYYAILKQCKDKILLISHIGIIHNYMIIFDKLYSEKQFYEAKDIIFKLTELIANVYDDKFSEIIGEIKMCIVLKKCNLLQTCECVFLSNFIFIKDGDATFIKTVKSNKHNVIALCTDFIDKRILHSFSITILETFYQPILKCNYQISVGEDNTFYFIEISPIEIQLQYTEVYSNIIILFQYLKEHFTLSGNENNSTIFNTILEYSVREIFRLLFQYYESTIIPDIYNGLLKLEDILTETKTFEDALKKYKVFSDQHLDLISLIKQYKMVYTNKICFEYSKIAKDIMQKNLGSTKIIDIIFNEEKQYCEISTSAIEFITLLMKLLTTTNDEKHVVAAFIKNIILNYTIFMPEYHKDILKASPKIVAIFHNNCFYISEKINDCYRQDKLILAYKETLQIVEQVHRLEQTGAQHFCACVLKQIIELESMFANSKCFAVRVDSILHKSIQKIEFLKISWESTLPTNLYKNAIGQVLNSFSKKLLKLVITFPEYSDINEQLKNHLRTMTDFVNNLLSKTNLQKYVPEWAKIEEIMKMFSSPLSQVTEKWGNGRGSLGSIFNNSEIKSLIKVIFPHNEATEKFLATIVD